MPAFQRDFLPGDLPSETATAGVSGTVAVSRQSVAETYSLLACAAQEACHAEYGGMGSAGSPEFSEIPDELRDYRTLKGVRHVVQDEPDDIFILGQVSNESVARLQASDLAYGLLIHERHLPLCCTLPSLRGVTRDGDGAGPSG